MDIATIEADAARLILPAFDEAAAWKLGAILYDLAMAGAMPVVINIRSSDRVLFHVSLPGSSGVNDNWARRKGNVALLFRKASLQVAMVYEDRGRSLAGDGVSDADYVLSGGAVPIVVRGAGMVAVATVSGLPQVEDHLLVVKGLGLLLAAG